MAPADELKTAWRRLAKQWHPDLHAAGNRVTAEERFKALGSAYREALEQLRTAGSSPPPPPRPPPPPTPVPGPGEEDPMDLLFGAESLWDRG